MNGRWVWMGAVGIGVIACGPLVDLPDAGADADTSSDGSTGEASDDGDSGSSNASEDEGESTAAPLPDPGTTGALRWLRVLDGGGEDFGHYVAIDGEGEVVLSGVRGDPAAGLLPFITALDREGNTSWDLDLVVGHTSDGGVTMESVATAHVIVYGDTPPYLLGLTQGQITEFAPGGSAGGANGFATVGRFADGAHAVGVRSGFDEPWIERMVNGAPEWSYGVAGVSDGQVAFLAPLDDDMIALVNDYALGTNRLLRVSSLGELEWSIDIPCAGTIAASPFGITVANGPDGALCRITPAGVVVADPFAVHLTSMPGAVGVAGDGDLLALIWPDEDGAVTVARVDLANGVEWSTQIDEAGLLPFSIAVAPDGSSATTGVIAAGGGIYDAFVFVLDP